MPKHSSYVTRCPRHFWTERGTLDIMWLENPWIHSCVGQRQLLQPQPGQLGLQQSTSTINTRAVQSVRRTRNMFMCIRILQIRNPPAPIMQKYRCTSESLESVIRKDPNYFAGSTLVPRIRIQINNPDPDLTTSVYRKFASHHKVKWSHKHWCRKTHFLLTFLNDCSKFYQGFKKIAKKKYNTSFQSR